jgi:spore coat polysaccharide biosynthesis predicted glycosyltransferase SpsG
MRYVLRADASRLSGAGHVMRSSAIAEELITRGELVIFVGQISDLPWVEERISSLGFNQICNDASQFVSNPETDILILDSYEIDIDDSFIACEKWLSVVVIVDELTPNYPCKIRIHPGIDSSFVGNSTTPVLAGPRYVPFRNSLSKNLSAGGNDNSILRIAVVAGGSDPYGLVNEIAKILVKIEKEFEVYLFVRSKSGLVLDSRFSLIEIGDQLDAITRNVDLVLTSASTSSLEFLARGLCVGVVCIVDNQVQNYISLGKLGVVAQLGIRKTDNTWELDAQKIHNLVTSSDLRRSIVSKATGLFDFNGASRIVDAITSL